jgi:hypothetical protein
VDEVILRTLVIQFDGRVVEVFGTPSGLVQRQHVALMTEPKILAPDSKGRCVVKVAGARFGVDADELPALKALLQKISQAIRVAKDQPPLQAPN